MGEGLITPHRKKPVCYEMLGMALELAGCCEHVNEHPGSTESGGCLDWLSGY